MTAGRSKQELIDELVAEFRESANRDAAFDNLAAERLGVSRTDLHCLNIIENAGGLTAGELGAAAGFTSGAVTGVIDRLERAGYAGRTPDPADRRRVKVEVTPEFRRRAASIWGPVKAEWDERLASSFTAEELELVMAFLRETNEIATRHANRLDRASEDSAAAAR